MSDWRGGFQSKTLGIVYGTLKTKLKPWTEMDYDATVSVQFCGPMVLISSIFSSHMNPVVRVKQGKEFTTKIGKADVVFYIDTDLTPETKEVRGHYVSKVPSRNYSSKGTFFLKKDC